MRYLILETFLNEENEKGNIVIDEKNNIVTDENNIVVKMLLG